MNAFATKQGTGTDDAYNVLNVHLKPPVPQNVATADGSDIGDTVSSAGHPVTATVFLVADPEASSLFPYIYWARLCAQSAPHFASWHKSLLASTRPSPSVVLLCKLAKELNESILSTATLEILLGDER